MTNRSRLTITPGGPWRLYQHVAPPGWDMLGTVQRGDEIGALARNRATGILVMMRAGAVSMLDQSKAAAALGMAGRPSEMEGGKRVNVYLDAESLAIAAKLGNGNVSDGIRKALKQAE